MSRSGVYYSTLVQLLCIDAQKSRYYSSVLQVREHVHKWAEEQAGGKESAELDTTDGAQVLHQNISSCDAEPGAVLHIL